MSVDGLAVVRVRSTVETTDFNQDLAFRFPFAPSDRLPKCLFTLDSGSFIRWLLKQSSQLAPDICTVPSINQANCNEF